METEIRIVKRVKNYFTTKCLFGICPNCTRIKEGIGYHEVKILEIFHTTTTFTCEECDGDGYVEETCPHCDGLGVVDETCECCDGKGKIADEDEELEFEKTEIELIKGK